MTRPLDSIIDPCDMPSRSACAEEDPSDVRKRRRESDDYFCDDDDVPRSRIVDRGGWRCEGPFLHREYYRGALFRECIVWERGTVLEVRQHDDDERTALVEYDNGRRQSVDADRLRRVDP